jgi:hypothetical protein
MAPSSPTGGRGRRSSSLHGVDGPEAEPALSSRTRGRHRARRTNRHLANPHGCLRPCTRRRALELRPRPTGSRWPSRTLFMRSTDHERPDGTGSAEDGVPSHAICRPLRSSVEFL